MPDSANESFYFKQFFKHRYNVLAMLGAIGASGFLAGQVDPGMASLPLLAYGAFASVAALFVPYSAKFRQRVDAERNRVKRASLREFLLSELTRRSHGGSQWGAYQRMQQRVDALRKVAENRRTALTLADVERLEDATLDFLGLWMALLAMQERERAFNLDAVSYRLREVEARLATEQSVEDRRRLEQAKQDFSSVLSRRDQTQARQASVEASMLALADTFEEIYQAVMTDPRSTAVSRQLQEAVDRVRLHDQVVEVFDEDLARFLPETLVRATNEVKAMGS